MKYSYKNAQTTGGLLENIYASFLMETFFQDYLFAKSVHHQPRMHKNKNKKNNNNMYRKKNMYPFRRCIFLWRGKYRTRKVQQQYTLEINLSIVCKCKKKIRGVGEKEKRKINK